ncbi:hypothetical protein Glove_421g110 [Diversispora epigaea]|uniref:Uncharacterized protein n=1 Tax=Diversispora epigaea TaxID=1348612 RepID=A0A397H3I0_9GLOM|nr:hypothetical protein Glove_421g110 [Diversispora epigaea]
MESGYNTIISLKVLKALNIAQELSTDYTQKEIEQNVRILKTKLGSPITNADENLYGALKKNIDGGFNVSELTWRDPIASTVLKNNRRKTKVVNILLKMESGYNTIISLKVLKALNIAQELSTDYTQKEIEQNVRILKTKLGSPITNADENLYGALKKNIDGGFNVSELTWRDPIASTVLSDDSEIIKNLSYRQRRTFMEPQENIKCEVPQLISSRVDEFIENFNEIDNSDHIRNIMHDKTWKEDEGEVWNNPAFETSTSRNEQTERQSLASKARVDNRTGKEKMGKKPDIMALEKFKGKLVEFLYLESSCVVCNVTKKDDDKIKLWRELLDGVSYINTACRLISNQFGVVGIQVTGEKIYLNVLMNDASGIPRYFHLDHAKIPLTINMSSRVKPLMRLLLTLRNILIVNKSLLIQALEQAISHPPRNTHPSPTVSSTSVRRSSPKPRKRKSTQFEDK